MYRALAFLLLLLLLGCQNETQNPSETEEEKFEEVFPNLMFGVDLNEFDVKTLKIKRGDTFGKILED
ncbi:MAG: M23 family peptidase, partial [Flavobacteriaceae bacterium]